jgi:hypothetical protein
MRITVISYDNWGLNSHLINTLNQKGHTVQHINIFDFKYKYPNFTSKLYNFFFKLFFNKNIKNIYYGNEILRKLKENNEIQDVILTIKGDFIDSEKILEFKKYTKKSIAFFNDSITRCPKIKRVLTCFDEVYSFEKEDCNKYNLKFISNWIYPIQIRENNKVQYQVFNISSRDNRLPIISKIGSILKNLNINFKFIVFDKKNKLKDPNIEYRANQIPLSEVNDFINNAQILLDINRKGQKGLTFRVFESLSLEKKLITTNSDIKNYDFYDPNNILIINEKNIIIPLDFFENEYKKIPDAIVKKYLVENWINHVLKLK